MENNKLKCPKCGHPQYCPCKHCAEGNKGKVTWVYRGDFVECGKCGFTQHIDWWEDLSMELHCEVK